MPNIIFTIAMPTFNSGKTIKKALDSIMTQNFDLNSLECLVIDGGSTDETIEIASRYPFVSILNNPKRLPEYAKLIGIKNAKGKYIIKMDSDESFENISVLSKRYDAVRHFPNAHIIVANELKPDGDEIANAYLNYCGDPFTYFIYRPKSTILKTYKKNIVKKHNGICLLKFGEMDNRPIADGGTTTVDLGFVKKYVNKNEFDITFASSIADFIFDKTGYCICIEDDNVLHNSRGTLKAYLKKIKFRIVNNVFSPSESGFSNRKVSTKRKKYFFPLYVLLFLPPLVDSFYLSVVHKDICFMLHIFYCYYTLLLIGYCYFLKILKIRKVNREY